MVNLINFDWQSSASLKSIEKDPHLNPWSCHLQWSRVRTNAASRSQNLRFGRSKTYATNREAYLGKNIGFVMMHHDMSWFTEFLVIRGSIKTLCFFLLFLDTLCINLCISQNRARLATMRHWKIFKHFSRVCALDRILLAASVAGIHLPPTSGWIQIESSTIN